MGFAMAQAYIKGSPKKVLKLEEVLKRPVDLVMADNRKASHQVDHRVGGRLCLKTSNLF